VSRTNIATTKGGDNRCVDALVGAPMSIVGSFTLTWLWSWHPGAGPRSESWLLRWPPGAARSYKWANGPHTGSSASKGPATKKKAKQTRLFTLRSMIGTKYNSRDVYVNAVPTPQTSRWGMRPSSHQLDHVCRRGPDGRVGTVQQSPNSFSPSVPCTVAPRVLGA